jgi:hypothetical protein
MAKTWYCKSNQHDRCSGKTIVGPPQPLSSEKCKCDCHKGTSHTMTELSLGELARAHNESAKLREILEPFGAVSLGTWLVDENGKLLEVLRGTGPNGEPVGDYRD